MTPTRTHTRQDSDGCTSLILAIGKEYEAAAEVLIAPTANAGALDVKVGGREEVGFERVYVDGEVEVEVVWR